MLDKYEYKLKIDQIKSLSDKEEYDKAAEIADEINWKKVKNVNTLTRIGEVYEKAKRYSDSVDVLLMAYDRSPIGRKIVYSLAEVSIKAGDIDAAFEYYNEFLEIAPNDSLKYILRYHIAQAKKAPLTEQIEILEELKQVEYSEQWAYELAYLYRLADMPERCIEVCDELVLWFGDGIYVLKALELKMLYQPLPADQNDKYQLIKQELSGVVQVTPTEKLHSGEIVNEAMTIPQVTTSNPSRFNTVNLQNELAKSMQEIMEATKKEEVADTLSNVKKIVEDIPYLQMTPQDETQIIKDDEQIDVSLKNDFQELLAEDNDGQISMKLPENEAIEHQITGQISIDDILAEWEKTKHAAEVAMENANMRKLESARARALQETGSLMEQLKDVINEENIKAREDKEDNNPIEPETKINIFEPADKEADNLSDAIAASDEESSADEQWDGYAVAASDEESKNAWIDEDELEEESEKAPLDEQGHASEEVLEEEISSVPRRELSFLRRHSRGLDDDIDRDDQIEAADFAENIKAPDTSSETEISIKDKLSGALKEGMGQIKKAQQDIDNILNKPDNELPDPTQELPSLDEFAINQAKKEQEKERAEAQLIAGVLSYAGINNEKEDNVDGGVTMPIIAPPEEVIENIVPAEDEEDIVSMNELSVELKKIFSYFVPVGGMEQQICQALLGLSQRNNSDNTSKSGNLIIQGYAGSGKTQMASNILKALETMDRKIDGRLGRIYGRSLNAKNVSDVVSKVKGGCLIIEKAGEITTKTARDLSAVMDSDTGHLLVVIEDTRAGIEAALKLDDGFAAKFTEKISIPIFTSDELVAFAKIYASDNGYSIDEMGILALYNRIGNVQRQDQATTLTEVKDILDEAIENSQKNSIRKAFGNVFSKNKAAGDKVLLERDFSN